jgi:hypothetical protein
LIGRYENTVSGSMRFNPSSRISRTTNELAAFADMAVTLRPTMAHAFVQRDKIIVAFMQDTRIEIQPERQPFLTNG